MEEPQRSIVAKNYEMIKAGWEEMLDRTRENLKAGSDPMDLIAAEGGFLLGTEEQSSENLAFTVAAIAVVEAQRSPRSRGARKAAVPAKRKKAVTTPQDVRDARAKNAAAMDRLTLEAGDAGREVAVEITDVPNSQALSDYADQKILEGEDV